MSILQQLFASLHLEKVHVVNDLHISLHLFNFLVPHKMGALTLPCDVTALKCKDPPVPP